MTTASLTVHCLSQESLPSVEQDCHFGVWSSITFQLCSECCEIAGLVAQQCVENVNPDSACVLMGLLLCHSRRTVDLFSTCFQRCWSGIHICSCTRKGDWKWGYWYTDLTTCLGVAASMSKSINLTMLHTELHEKMFFKSSFFLLFFGINHPITSEGSKKVMSVLNMWKLLSVT